MQIAVLLNATPRGWPIDTGCMPRSAEPSAAGFAFLQSNLSASGGAPDSEAIVLMLRAHRAQPVSWLAQAILRRELVHFSWNSRLFVPLFQFDLFDMGLREGVSEVIETLAAVLDDWQLSTWFAEPNAWLRGARPADVLRRDRRAVVQAAWADEQLAAERPALPSSNWE